MLKNLTVAAALLLARQRRRAGQVSDPSRSACWCRFRPGSADRFSGALDRPENRRELGPAGGGRQPAERGRHHRLRILLSAQPRRPHADDGVDRPCRQRVALLQAAVQHGQGFCRRHAGRDVPNVLLVTPTLGLKSVKDLIALRQIEARADQLRLGGRRQRHADQRRDVQACDRHQRRARAVQGHARGAQQHHFAAACSSSFRRLLVAVPQVKGGKVSALAVTPRDPLAGVARPAEACGGRGLPASTSISGPACWSGEDAEDVKVKLLNKRWCAFSNLPRR